MTWFRVDDRLPDHRKVRKAGTSAMGLWVLAGSWSSGHLTDGWVPLDVALRYGTQRQAERLVAAGLWEPATVDGDPGWVFHQWTEHQPTREQVNQKRKAAADRQARWRAKGEGHAREQVEAPGVSQGNFAEVQPTDSGELFPVVTGGGPASRRDRRVSNAVSNAAPVPTRPDHNYNNKNSPRFAADADFLAFYAAYPKRIAKKAAEKAWAKAVKDGATPSVLIEAARRYATGRDGQDPKFTKQPATWLNQGCWEDEPERPHLRAVSGGYQPWTNPADHSVYDEEL